MARKENVVLVEQEKVQNVEKKDGDYYLEGIACKANVINGNGRYYPLEVVEKEMANFLANYVKKNRALGELNHPPDEKVDVIDYFRVSHSIKDIYKDANDPTVYRAKLKILNNFVGREYVIPLLKEGYVFGLSTRAVGSLRYDPLKNAEVVEEMHLFTIDLVHDPSSPGAFVKPITESYERLKKKKLLQEYKGKVYPVIYNNNSLEGKLYATILEVFKTLGDEREAIIILEEYNWNIKKLYRDILAAINSILLV